MARESVVVFKVTSDLSGEQFETEDKPLKFGYDGVSYEIDLTESETEEFDKIMQKYVDVATEIPPHRAIVAGSGDQSKMRAFFKEHADLIPEGVTLADRGRIPKQLQEIYKSHNK